ncbi:hypothetical protein [Baaleninema sp.]|uniref:hypothetical protein n=1 Tax=Baaleninema sp. TaxID=3101197 RepID=UPI003D0857B3
MKAFTNLSLVALGSLLAFGGLPSEVYAGSKALELMKNPKISQGEGAESHSNAASSDIETAIEENEVSAELERDSNGSQGDRTEGEIPKGTLEELPEEDDPLTEFEPDIDRLQILLEADRLYLSGNYSDAEALYRQLTFSPA